MHKKQVQFYNLYNLQRHFWTCPESVEHGYMSNKISCHHNPLYDIKKFLIEITDQRKWLNSTQLSKQPKITIHP